MEIYLIARGRLGNALFRYFAAILFIVNNEYKYTTTINRLQQKVIINDKIFDKLIQNNTFNQYLDKNLELQGYFQYDSIYRKYKSEILSYMKDHPNDLLLTDGNKENSKGYNYNQETYKVGDLIIPDNFSKCYKTVIHLRLEDFVKLNFCIKVEKIIELLDILELEDCCIVVKPINLDFEKNYIQKINKFYEKKYNKPIQVESNSVVEDFYIMQNAETLICSLSTLSWCAALISNKIKTCYMPDWNHNTPGIGSHTRCKKPIENTIFYSI